MMLQCAALTRHASLSDPSPAWDIAVVGAGAAGLMAAIWAGRTAPGRRIIALDGARTLGAKILVAGGGRCNVTHDVIDERAYAGSTRPAIRNVLRRFDVPRTIEFFRELGVTLKREETGKLFPTTDKARTVLNALLEAAREAGAVIHHPFRVETIEVCERRFLVGSNDRTLVADRVIVATGGRSLPKSGSDGHGYEMVRRLGHSITKRILPALVPLTLPRDHVVCTLSGIALPATLEVHASSGRRLVAFTDSTLCAHFGISGPSALDISRYFLDAQLDDPATKLIANWAPGRSLADVEHMLLSGGPVSAARVLAALLPERMAKALCEAVDLAPATPCHALRKVERRKLAQQVVAMSLPISGSRGFGDAEVTAGGVPLREMHLPTLASRVCPGLFLCGEILDVDGRIGGYSFQWAWASGYVAGTAAGKSINAEAAA